MSRKKYIKKDLEKEDKLTSEISYFKLLGPSQIHNFRSPDSYVFILFKKTSGNHTVDFIEYTQNDKQIHISFPGQIHSWNTGDDADGHKLIVSKNFIEKSLYAAQFIQLKNNIYPIIDLDLCNFLEIETEFLSIAKEFEKEIKRWEIINLKTQLFITLVNKLIERNIEKINVIPLPRLLNKFNVLIQENYRTHKTVNSYADLLFITPNYLNIITRKYLHMSAKDVINQRILLETKRLLQGSDMSIKEITFFLGFSEVSHFSTFVKKKTGFKPSDYRK